MAQPIALNIGDDFVADCIYRDADGEPVDLDVGGIVITAEVLPEAPSASPESAIALGVTRGNQGAAPGTFAVRGNTGAWFAAAGYRKWQAIIRFSAAQGKFSTRKFAITLE